ncbi:MAG TPA: hypothetical protein VMW69_00550, partial [Spirochaetia bacterium]|nr:hypothetical protein [Spirochaetia bacterium]
RSTGTSGPAGSRGDVPLELTAGGGTKTLRLLLSQKTWPAIAALTPFRNDPLLASLGPQGDHHYTEAEYMNLMEYAFADYASKDKVSEAITSSAVDIKVTVKGTIVSQSGGTLEGNTVSFRIPLVRLVTLAQPIELSVTFR